MTTISDKTIASKRYSVRPATAADATVIAHHRAVMFREMGALADEAEFSTIYRASIPWVQELLVRQEYFGWFVLLEEEVVAGGGLHLGSTGPVRAVRERVGPAISPTSTRGRRIGEKALRGCFWVRFFSGLRRTGSTT